MAPHTFLWHDYETFGANTRRDRPAQFAAIRTDAELNEIGEPLMFYCQPANDYLPDPVSCLITGITPQLCLEKGVPEHTFAARRLGIRPKGVLQHGVGHEKSSGSKKPPMVRACC